MTEAPAGAQEPPGATTSRRVLVYAVSVTLLTQVLASAALVAQSVIVPVAAPDLGVRAQSIGVFVSLVYLIAVIAGLVAPAFVRRFGPLRVCQITILLLAAGLGVGATGHIALLPLMVILIGIPYGVVNPTSSHILSTHAPPAFMSLAFSIKQCGVPIGAAVAGILVPALLLAMHWQWTLFALAAGCAVFAIAFQPFRARFDTERTSELTVRVGRLGAPVAAVWGNPRLRDLAIGGCTFSFVQVIVITYSVSYLNLEIGLSLVAAGLAFSSAQAASVLGRIGWGVVADRWLSAPSVLGIVGIAVSILLVLLASIGGTWPFAAIVAVVTLVGLTGLGWNGVHFAEVARRAPSGEVATSASGIQFFSFGGALLAPIVFGTLVSVTGAYATGFALLALPPLCVGLRFLFSRA
jgi:MFS family permease